MNQEHKEQLAQWFETCGLEEIDTQAVANIIRKWKPEDTFDITPEMILANYNHRGTPKIGLIKAAREFVPYRSLVSAKRLVERLFVFDASGNFKVNPLDK